jgi:riboflavin biosynthesis pyrimidine reductase
VAAGRVGATQRGRQAPWGRRRGLLLDVKRNVELAAMLANLTARGIGRLFAEGGTVIHTQLTSRSDLVQYLKSR